MMPPPHLCNNNNRNRVENIKKKFEDINKFVPVSDNLNNSRPSVPQRNSGKQKDLVNFDTKCRSETSKQPKLTCDSKRPTDLYSNNQSPLKSHNAGHPLLERQISSPTSRGHIKRSPAFRCDRIVKGKNVLNPTGGSVCERPQSVVDTRVKQFNPSSPPDSVSVKPCVEHNIPRNSSVIELCNNAEVATQASTSITGNVTRPLKVPFDSDHRGPIEAKRNKLSHGKECILSVNHNGGVSSSGGWLHNQLGKDTNRLDSEPSGSQVSPKNCVLSKNLFTEVKLKKVNKDLDVGSSRCDQVKVFSDNLELNTSSSPSGPQHSLTKSLTHTPLSAVDNVVPRDANVSHQSRLTDTLKAALKAPLPCGPPPKKPPRTFAHNSPAVPVSSQKSCDGNSSAISKSAFNSPCHTSIASQVVIKPVRSKTESQIMLRKLENALLNHRTSSKDTSPGRTVEEAAGDKTTQISCESPSNFSFQTGQNVCVTPSQAARSGCLSLLQCAAGPIKCSEETEDCVHTNETEPPDFILDPKRKSSLQDNASGSKQKLPGYLHKSHSVEHIYAEPFQYMGDGFQVCKSKDCEANFRSLSSNRELSKQKLNPKRILSTSPEHTFRAWRASPVDSNSEGLHYLCTPIQENSPLPAVELHMSSLPLRLSPSVDIANHEIFKRPSRECLSLEVQPCNVSNPVPKLALKRSSAEKDKSAKDMADNNLNSTKIKFLMNQAFGSPLQCLPATPLDSNSDSDSIVSTPDEGVSVAPFPGVPSPPIQMKSKEITRPSCPPPDIPELVSPSKESLQQLTAERRTYVRRVSSHVMGQRSLRQTPHSSASTHLFECLLLVGLNLDPERPKCKVPYIKSKFPPEAIVPTHIENLCFPDAGEWPPPLCNKSSNECFPGEEQSYSLVVTSDTGDRKYGYCRRVQPEGAPICLPLAYCILSPHRASGFYFKILTELESRHGEPEIQQNEFIQHLYECAFPSPGQGLRVNGSGQHISVGCTGTSSSNSSSGTSTTGSGTKGSVVLRRPYDTRLEDCDLTRLFNSLQIHVFLQVFSSLLLERKVLLLSKSISKLSACVDALQSILFPFVWQHTFIPVLPTNMIDICQAPTPFVIGVLKGRHTILPPVSIDHGIVVDVDNSLILQSQQDETTILPSGINRSLKIALQLAQNSTKPDHPSRNVLVSEAFLRTFVEVCGHYETHIVTQQDGKKLFERESFIKAARSRSIQMFLEWFTETSMFSAFIESRLEKPEETKGVFEQRISEHHEEREKNTSLYLKNYKGLNKKVKTLGDRFKDWAPFS